MHAVLSAPADPVQDIDPGRILEALVRLRQGDTDVRLPLDWPGLWGRVADAFNEVVAHHLRLRHDLTRLSHVVGKEGRLKERARVPECAGFWTESAEAVNSLITDLVHPTSEVARVIGAVAQGDLSKSMAQDIDGRPLRGEFLRTARVINRMVKQLGTFAAEVTRVAREVGTEGKLGGQADVQGVAGTWKDLTDNVNQLAANLTTQVRAIAEVAMAVTQGDLTRSVTVQARGEVAALKDTINEMIRNLRDTTRVNTEQDWLKTNLAKFSRLLQGQKEMVAVGHAILSELAPVVGAQRSGFYVLEAPAGAASAPQLRLTASYAGDGPSRSGQVLALGEGLVGQCALDRRKILLAGATCPRPSRSPPAWGRSHRAASSCCPSCSRGRCAGSSSWPRQAA